jgi:2-polyprenyl-3-methyl-5-hydroxy-6-metoxy-1,4-benzoquinol methylase
MPTVRSRLVSERLFHDQQAKERAETFSREPERLRFESADYLEHESWIRPAMEKLGDVRGRDVLDFGCGHGMAAVILARMGARVSGFDLSSGYIREALQRAEANDVRVNFVQADAELLPFSDQSFDRVWGSAILHHLDIRRAGQEIFRIMRPGAVAVFCEPCGANRLLNWARSRFQHRSQKRTRDERPLMTRDLEILRGIFRSVSVEGYQFLSAAAKVVDGRWLCRSLDAIDSIVLRRVPFLQKYCRYVVVRIVR